MRTSEERKARAAVSIQNPKQNQNQDETVATVRAKINTKTVQHQLTVSNMLLAKLINVETDTRSG
jgi:hypothetical protein